MSVAAIFFMCGCTDDDEEPITPPAVPETEIELRLNYVVPDNDFGALAPSVWTQDAAAGVFAEGTTNSRFALKSGAGTAAATFTGKVTGTPGICYAYYPYGETASMNGGKLGAVLPGEQRYTTEGVLPEYFIRVGRSGDGAAEMRDVTGIVAVRISSPFELLVKELTFRAAAGQFVAGRIDVDMNYTDGQLQTEVMGNRTGTLSLLLPEEGVTVNAGEAAVFYLVMAAGEYSGYTLTVKAQDEEDMVIAPETPLVVERASLTTAEVVYEPKQEPLPEGTDLNDPARYGIGGTDPVYANCYITDGAGDYFIRATVLGNGQEGIIPEGGFHVSSAAIAPLSAALVWEDAEGTVSDVRLSAEGGYVCFKAAAGPGNAVIAVYDAEDGGNILWSWHVWVAGQMPGDQRYKTPEGTDSYLVMDRNLGAEYCPQGNDEIAAMTNDQKFASYGLLYQWGRKDPFPGSAALTGLKEAPIYGQYTEVQKISYSETNDRENNNLLYAARNPATLIFCSTPSADWVFEQNNRLWGNPEGYGDGTAYPKGAKTIYDPCPPGYMVAPANLWLASDFESNYVGKFAAGWIFTYDGENQSWYPGAGLRWEDDAAIGDAGQGGSYWSNSPASATDKTAIDFYCYRGTTNILNKDKYSRAGALSVRCIRDL